MKAVLHYTRQYAQVISLPDSSSPPEVIEGLGGIEFRRVELEPTDNRALTAQHHHYCPAGSELLIAELDMFT